MANRNIRVLDKKGNIIYIPSNLDLAENIGTLPINKGGTNAATSADARKNLDVYSKNEIDSKIAGIDQFQYKVVSELPIASKDTEFIIYLVSDTEALDGSYVEYLTVKKDNTYIWEQIGTTAANLSDYSKNTHIHTFTGNEEAINVSGSYKKAQKIISGNGDITFTPSGSIDIIREKDLSLNTKNINIIDSVGTLPSLSSIETSAENTINYLSDVNINNNLNVSYSDPVFTKSNIYLIDNLGSLPELTSNSTVQNGVKYVSDITYSNYTPAGTVESTFAGDEITKKITFKSAGTINLNSDTIAENGIPYIENISITQGEKTNQYLHKTSKDYLSDIKIIKNEQSIDTVSAQDKYLTADFTGNEITKKISITPSGTISLTDGTAPSLTFSDTETAGSTQIITNVSSTDARTESDIFIKTIDGGSGSLTSNNTAENGIPYVSSLTAINVQPEGNISGNIEGNTLVLSFKGNIINGLVSAGETKYLHHEHTAAKTLTTGSAVTSIINGKITTNKSYMKFNAGTTPISSATFDGRVSESSISFTPSGSVTLNTAAEQSLKAIKYIDGITVSKSNKFISNIETTKTSAINDILVSDTAAVNDIRLLTDIGDISIAPSTKYLHPNFIGNNVSQDITFKPSGKIESTFTGTNNIDVAIDSTYKYIHFNAGSLPTKSTTATEVFTGISKEGSAILNGDVSLDKSVKYLKFDKGTLPTKTEAISIATSIKEQPVFNSTFTGNNISLELSYVDENINSTGSFTPKGKISKAE